GPYSRTISAISTVERLTLFSLINRQRSRKQQRRCETGHRQGHPTKSSPAAERLHLACRRERIERALHRALARSQRKRQRRARPGFTVGEEGKHRSMLVFDGAREYDNLTCAARQQHEPSLRRTHAGQQTKHPAKPRDFDSQPRAM